MLRKLLSLTLALITIAASASAYCPLSEPNHASYDEIYNRYLISSAANHAIIAIDSVGEQTCFLTGLGSYVFGNFICGDTLYVTGSYGWVRAFDLNSGSLLWTQPIAGAHYTDGMAMDAAGHLYIVDNYGYNSKIYKMNPTDQSYETFVSSGLPAFSLKLVFDEPNNRLLVIGYGMNSPITAVNLDDGSLTPVVTPPNFNLGSIAIDNDRNVYVSNYYEGNVYRYDQTFTNPPVLISSHGNGIVTGVGYDHVHNLLIVPKFDSNSVDFVSLDDTDDDGIIDINDNCPNEANPGQEDFDTDGAGDPCDLCTDTDDDGFGDPGFEANTCIDDNCPDVPNPDQSDIDQDSIGDACDWICGDADASGGADIDDAVYLISHIFSGGPEPVPYESGDADCSGGIDIDDVVYLIAYIFSGGNTPCDINGDAVPDCRALLSH